MSSEYKNELDRILYQARLKQALVQQHQKYFDYDTGKIKPELAENLACPVCNSSSHELYFQKDLFKFVRCRDCSMIFLNPRLNQEATYSFYNEAWTLIYNEEKFEANDNSENPDNQINQANLSLLKKHLKSGGMNRPKLLELGFGSGFFLKSADQADFEVWGVDVDRKNCERARAKFGDRIVEGDLFSAKFPDETFDVVYLRDVFEHVPNPKPLLTEMRRILKANGLLYIEVPNMDGLIYKFVGSRHVCIFGFAHLNYWSLQTLTRLLTDQKMAPVSTEHDSRDFTLRDIWGYYANPAFTSIVPTRSNLLLRAAAWFFVRFFSLPGIRDLDRLILPKIANLLSRGSVVRVLSRKLAER